MRIKNKDFGNGGYKDSVIGRKMFKLLKNWIVFDRRIKIIKFPSMSDIDIVGWNADFIKKYRKKLIYC